MQATSMIRSLAVVAACSMAFCLPVHAQQGNPTIANATLPHVVILATGGTIAETGAEKTTVVGYSTNKVGIEKLVDAVPEMRKIARLSGEQVYQIDSSDMDVDHWLNLLKKVNAALAQPDVAGVVITHGTDTMEETAYFLNLTVKSHKPVVLTGSMRPSTAHSADGPLNLYNAVAVAASPNSVGKGALVVMNDHILSARDVTKTNTFTVDTFKSPELGALGYIQGGRTEFYHASTRKNTADSEFDVSNLNTLPRVDIVYSYAEVTPSALNAFVSAGSKGVVYAGVGDGSVSTKMLPALSAAHAKGLTIVRSSRVGQGIVARNGEVDDEKQGFVASDTLNPQKARILLMLGLTKTNDPHELQRMFNTY
ncbi:L-asparaginase [Burkholderia sp. MSMB1459WGS]|uniref:type II asparaginase n=1 Tax=Burkholderia sp. MSMB1459WGS TaxID=1637970 RepID=UPI00075FA7D0|nr:L-asparaginase [Burkholderia sp. MSMB1459WGS]